MPVPAQLELGEAAIEIGPDFTVTIEGVAMAGSPYTVGASSDTVLKFPGISGGPVVVSADTGAKIIASLYELRRDPSLRGWNGQSEMMGVPWEELSDSYVIPRYYGAVNPNTLDMRIFIANPDSVARLGQQLDFDASEAFSGTRSHEEVADALWQNVLDIAQGTATWGELLMEGEEVIARFGAAL